MRGEFLGTYFGGHAAGALPDGNMIIRGTGGGGLVRILPLTSYTFALNSGATPIVFAKYIDVSMWSSLSLVVRIQALNTGAGGTFYLGVWGTSFCEEDPATDYVTDSSYARATAVAVTTNINSATPNLIVIPFVSAAGNGNPAQLRGVIVGNGPTGGSALTVRLGADLVGRMSS